MKGIRGFSALALTLTLLTGCNRDSGTSSDREKESAVRIQPVLADAAADGGYLPLRIEKVYEKQKGLDQTPWHADGGDWTFLECAPQSDTSIKILVGNRTRPASKNSNEEFPVNWGEARLVIEDSNAAARFIETFARAFHTSVPASHGNKPAGFLRMNTADLGSGLTREAQGGFNVKPGGMWTATKWFLEDESVEAEVFFNFNITEKRAEFSEKDPDYREDLVQELVIGLRDGPLPERTPENDPTLTLNGPRVVNWIPIANSNETCHFSAESDLIAITASGGVNHSKVYLATVERPSERKLLAEFDGLIIVHQFFTLDHRIQLLVTEAFRKDRHTISSADPQKFWLIDDQGKRSIALPEAATNWFISNNGGLSPDGRFLAMQAWRTQPNKKRIRTVQVGDLQNGSWHTAQLPDTQLEFIGWAEGPKGIVLTGNGFGKETRRPYSLDVNTGTLSPLDSLPAKLDPRISPDRKHYVDLIERDRLIISELAGIQKQEFVFHPNDRRNAIRGSVHWLDNRYLEFDGSWPACIDSQTLKMNFVTEKHSGVEFEEFSPNFKLAFGLSTNIRCLGTVELAK